MLYMARKTIVPAKMIRDIPEAIICIFIALEYLILTRFNKAKLTQFKYGEQDQETVCKMKISV